MSVARVGIEVQTDSVKAAVRDLTALADAGRKVDKSVDEATQAMRDAAAAATALSTSAKASDGALDMMGKRGEKVTQSIEALRRATAQLSTAEDVLQRAQRSGVATGEQLASAQERVAVARSRLAGATAEATKQALGFDNALNLTTKAMLEQSKEAKALAAAQRSLNNISGRISGAAGGATPAMLTKQAAATERLKQAQAAYNALLASSGADQNIAAQGLARVTTALNEQTLAAQRTTVELNQATTAQQRFTLQAKDTTGAMRANTGNIAAQFQDIGVTAAMGMNPMLIALQQGTQISAVLAQTGRGLGETLAGAFAMVLSPAALMVIAIVAISAALIQMVDWAKLSKSALEVLAKTMDLAADHAGYTTLAVVGLTAALLAANRVAIAGFIVALGKATLAASLLVAELTLLAGVWLLTPFGLITAGLAAVAAGFVFLTGEIFKNNDAMDSAGERAKWLANTMINAIVGAVRVMSSGVMSAAALVGNFFASVFNGLATLVENSVNGAIRNLNKLASGFNAVKRSLSGDLLPDVPTVAPISIGRAAGFNMGQFQAPGAIFRDQMRQDPVGAIGRGLRRGADALRGMVAGPAAPAAAAAAAGAGRAGAASAGRTPAAAASATAAQRNPYGDMVSALQGEIAALQQQTTAVDQSADAMLRLENQQKVLNDAKQKDIVLTQAQERQLLGLADQLTDLQLLQRDQTAMREMVKSAETQMQQLRDQTALLGLTGDALLLARNRQELLNDATQRGLRLTPEYRAQIEALAQSLTAAQSEAATTAFLTGDIAAHNERMDQIAAESAALRLFGDALVIARAEQEALNRVRREGITLSPAEQEALKQRARLEAEAGLAVAKARQEIEFYRETTKGFMRDFTDRLRQGASFWDAFANAAVNALNRIMDRLLDQVFNNALDKVFGMGGGGGGFGNILGTVLSVLKPGGGIGASALSAGAKVSSAPVRVGSAMANSANAAPLHLTLDMGDMGAREIMVDIATGVAVEVTGAALSGVANAQGRRAQYSVRRG